MRVSILFLLLAASGAAHATHGDPYHCVHATAARIACVPGTTDDASWRASLLVAAPAKTMPWQGNTVATVGSQFPIVINWEFETETAAQLNAQMAIMSDLTLARFSHEYWVESNGQLSTLMYYAAIKLTAPNLIRFRSAFSNATVDAAVAQFAPATTQAQYRALPGHAYIPQSHAMYLATGKLARTINAMPAGVAAPTIYMTPYEIYNEYLWTAAETESGALAMTVKFMSVELQIAAMIGWQAGGHFYHFAESLNPNYGYDIVTMYGDIGASDFGPIDGARTGRGYLNDSDITVIQVDSWGSSDVGR